MLGKLNSKLTSWEDQTYTYKFKRHHLVPILIPVFALALSLPLLVVGSQMSHNTYSDAQIGVEAASSEASEVVEDGAINTGTKVPATKKVAFTHAATAATSDNPIVTENQNPGTSAWTVGTAPVSSDTTKQIKGFASKASVNVGDTIDFKVTVNPAQSFNIQVYRLGWYQGLGGRLMQTIGPINGTSKTCSQNSTTKMVYCNWSTDYTLAVPTTWTTGSYLAKLTNNNGYVNYISFVVRDDSSHSDMIVQNSTNTWQAYNQFGGAALYPPGQTHGVKVSYDRPYTGNGAPVVVREINMIRFLEKEGYDLSYTTDVDTHERGDLLLNHKGFISMGHDEYWSWGMRDNVEGARDHGVGLAFFGGNESYWQVRLEPSATGVADRVMVGYKEQYKNDPNYASTDPNVKKKTSSLFRYSFENRPEQLMMGIQYGNNLGSVDAHINYITAGTTNWVYAGTNAVSGQNLGAIVGKEYNRVNTGAKPANLSFTILANSVNPTTKTVQNSVVYQSTSGAWVFSAGTMDWALGLDDYNRGVGHVNGVIQQMTRNILNKFAGSTVTPTLTPTPTTAASGSSFTESGGTVAFEAEHSTSNISRNAHTWANGSDSLAAGSTYINTSDAGLIFTPPNSAETQYSIYFNDPGTYYIWLRANSAGGTSNGISAGLDGAPASPVSFPTYKSWIWGDLDANKKPVTITVNSAGLHTFSVWERKDGTKLDRVVLSTSSTAPTGTGPSESAKR